MCPEFDSQTAHQIRVFLFKCEKSQLLSFRLENKLVIMHTEPIVYSIFLIFTGAAIVSTLVLYTRQSLLVAYMLLGVLIGPWGLGFIKDSAIIQLSLIHI